MHSPFSCKHVDACRQAAASTEAVWRMSLGHTAASTPADPAERPSYPNAHEPRSVLDLAAPAAGGVHHPRGPHRAQRP